jgi:ornithine carbamoyltransferase
VPITRRHLLSLTDLADEELRHLVDHGTLLADRPHVDPVLAGMTVGVYFRQTSTRTRVSFSVAAQLLGANVVTLGPADLQENTGETAADTAAVLSGMLDGIVIRSAASDELLRTYAGQDRMAVVSAMGQIEHPTQAVADFITIQQRFGKTDGVRLLYVGEGNNSAVALALGLTRFAGTELEVVTPPGYGLPAAIERTAAAQAEAAGSRFQAHTGIDDAQGPFDVVYTTRWQTTGTAKPDPRWREIFEPYRVDERLMSRFPSALFMHDLPAHRGEEVSAEVLDGPRSIALAQARNKLSGALAVLEWCLTGGGRL